MSHVSVEIDLGDFEDEDIIAEYEARNLGIHRTVQQLPRSIRALIAHVEKYGLCMTDEMALEQAIRDIGVKL